MDSGNTGSARNMSAANPKLAVSPVLCMSAVAFVVLMPAILFGYPTGHDTFLHATAWFDLLNHWGEGVILPAWGARFAMGWGQPVHLFYPPLSFHLGALYLLFFGPFFAPIAFAGTTLILAGYSAYRFARLLVPNNAALIAGVIYLLSPYLGLNLYERNAMAEALAAAIFPFSLRAFVGMQRDKRSPLLLAFTVALLLLTNVPATLAACTILVTIAFTEATQHRTFTPLFKTATAFATALLLAAFYVLPALTQKNFVRFKLLATGGQAPERNFELLAGRPLFHHDFFSYLALISIVLATLLVVLSIIVWRLKSLPMQGTWLAAAALSLLLMLPIAAPVYSSVPGFRLIIFPWRFLFPVVVFIAIFAARIMVDKGRWVLGVVAAAFAMAWFAMWPPTFLHDSYASWGRYSAARTAELPGVQEWMPITARYDEEGRYGPAQLVSVQAGGPCSMLQVLTWQSEKRLVRFDCSQETTLLIKTFFYPGWRILANGRPAEVHSNDRGALLVHVQGAGELEMRFVVTKDRKLGAAISLLTLSLCTVFAIRTRRQAHLRAAA